tara:strand:+ start:2204 stop:2449 length:246 start_codon:yes stop_codon:yes gene_type:complete
MSYLDELFNDSLDNINELYKVSLEKINNLENLLLEKNNIIEELKSIIYTTDYMFGDDSEGEAGISGYFLSDGDKDSSSSSD